MSDITTILYCILFVGIIFVLLIICGIVIELLIKVIPSLHNYSTKEIEEIKKLWKD